jgi:hypothetical protein
MILPCYYLGNRHGRLLHHASNWSIKQDLIPREVFGRLSHPIMFALFIKSKNRTLVGFSLYHKVAAIKQLHLRYQRIIEGTNSVWIKAVATAIRRLGGKATLQQIYSEVSKKPPTSNAFWKERIREVAQKNFERIDRATYAIPQH